MASSPLSLGVTALYSVLQLISDLCDLKSLSVIANTELSSICLLHYLNGTAY